MRMFRSEFDLYRTQRSMQVRILVLFAFKTNIYSSSRTNLNYAKLIPNNFSMDVSSMNDSSLCLDKCRCYSADHPWINVSSPSSYHLSSIPTGMSPLGMIHPSVWINVGVHIASQPWIIVSSP